MSQRQKSTKQKIKEELGELLLFLNGASDADQEQCLRFVESTLRRLIVLKGESPVGENGDFTGQPSRGCCPNRIPRHD